MSLDPTPRAGYPPVFVWPPRPLAAIRWFVGPNGYVWSYNTLYAAVAVVAWLVATPSRTTMATWDVDWVAAVLLRNAVVLIAWYGLFHLQLYVRRAQGTRYKFNARWPAERSERFTFGNQLRDNVLWTIASGLPMWTAWEVLTLWLMASGRIP